MHGTRIEFLISQLEYSTLTGKLFLFDAIVQLAILLRMNFVCFRTCKTINVNKPGGLSLNLFTFNNFVGGIVTWIMFEVFILAKLAIKHICHWMCNTIHYRIIR